jgi:hypothetical protein
MVINNTSTLEVSIHALSPLLKVGAGGAAGAAAGAVAWANAQSEIRTPAASAASPSTTREFSLNVMVYSCESELRGC